MRLAPLLALALVALSSATPLRGASPTILAAWEGDGPYWFVFDVPAGVAPTEIHFETDRVDRVLAQAGWSYDGAGRILGNAASLAYVGEAAVHARHAGSDIVHVRASSAASTWGYWQFGCDECVPTDTRRVFVGIEGGGVGHWRYELRGDPASRPDVRFGPALFVDETSFAGGDALRVSPGISSVGAYVARDGRFDARLDGPLYGFFGAASTDGTREPPPGGARLEGPRGGQDCPCIFPNLYARPWPVVDAPWPGGDYSFDTGRVAGNGSGVVLLAADPDLSFG